MSTPVLHVLAGPNGAGKSTFVREVLQPVTHLPFVNADEIAAKQWPGEEAVHAYEASQLAAGARESMFSSQSSFITETVFSHESKVQLIRHAVALDYLVTLEVILVPEDLAVRRVAYRVEDGGHSVPEAKIRERYQRLWGLVVEARSVASETRFYDNSAAVTPFRLVATYTHGVLVGSASWPAWKPAAL